VNKFNRAQMVSFIKAVDRHLEEEISLLIIGGAASSLAYDATIRASDIDVYSFIKGSLPDLGEATSKAREETGLLIEIGSASIAEMPYDYADRLKQLTRFGLKKLSIFVPDKYDLVLSKIVRGYKHDIDAVYSIHLQHPLSMQTLTARFDKDFISTITTDKRRVSLNMAILVSKLWGYERGKAFAIAHDVPIPTIE
jgi:Nucleotidyltransferase of unknown function (DUF6036)